MKYAVLAVVLMVTAMVAAGLPAEALPNEPGSPSILPVRQGAAPESPAPVAPVWTGLEEMSPVERANALIRLGTVGPAGSQAEAEARSIERLWNSNRCEEALARFCALGTVTDLSGLEIAVQWRTPVPGPSPTDWGTNVRIGVKDSIMNMAFDRHDPTGNLLIALQYNDASSRGLFPYYSPDGGRNWNSGTNVGMAYGIKDIAAVCARDKFYVAWTRNINPNMVRMTRFSTTTGQIVPFANDSQFVAPFRTTTPGESLVNLTLASGDDRNINNIYLLAATNQRKLYYYYSDTVAISWSTIATNVTTCDGGLACAINPNGHRALVTSWMTEINDSVARLAHGWRDDTNTVFRATSFNPTTFPYLRKATGIAALGDSVQMSFVHIATRHGNTAIRTIYTLDAGQLWNYANVTDTMENRENPDLCNHLGEGLGIVYREYSPGNERYLLYRHAASFGGAWTDPDTVNDWRPDPEEKPLVRWLEPGVFGVAYIKWYDEPGYTAWFNRTDFNSVAEREPANPLGSELNAIPGRGSVRFSFHNPARGLVRLSIFDAAGRRVYLQECELPAGDRELSCAGVSAGVFFARLEAGGTIARTKFFQLR